jgi:uncharacterized protein (TIGR03000 family)
MTVISSRFVAAALGCVCLLATAGDAAAQIRFQVGPSYNRGSYGSGYRNYGNYGQPGFGIRLGPNVSIGVGSSPRYQDRGYYDRGYYTPAPTYRESYYPAEPSYRESYAAPAPATSYASSGARVEVRLPDPNATVWFDEHRSEVSGSPRVFVFSSENDDRMYKHRVKASWNQDGRMVTQEREIEVRGGGTATVDFTRQKTRGEPLTPDLYSSNHTSAFGSGSLTSTRAPALEEAAGAGW